MSFRGKKILQSGHPDALSSKFLRPFLVVALKARAASAVFHRQNKTNKAVRYGNIFIFCSQYYRSKAIRRAGQGGARAVDLPRALV